MINALAPVTRRGCPWVGMSVVVALGFVLTFGAPAGVRAQPAKGAGATKKAPAAPQPEAKKAATPAKAEAKKRATPAKAADPEPAENNAGPEEDAQDQKRAKVEVFNDPNAAAALKIIKPLFKSAPGNLYSQVKSAAATPGTAIDRETVRKFVEAMAHDLTEKANINALINPPSTLTYKSPVARAVQNAVDNLIDVLQTARVSRNNEFLTMYNAVLLETLPKLLDNNLIARLQAMIVLGQTRDMNAVPVFIAQIKDPKQTVWVKLWAARGLNDVVDNGAKTDALSAALATDAARAISDVLDANKDLPWPAQARMLQALGSLRVSSTINSPKAEMATTAMRFLADPLARAEVKAEAARALGMLRINQATRNYNYALIAYDTGLTAADLAETINDVYARNPALAQYLTSYLVAPVHQAFNGIDGARESGLLKVPGGYPTMANTKQIADLTSAVTRAAVELVRGAPGQAPKFQKDLDDRIAGLKAYLDKNPPQGYRLVPNGPEFPRAKEEVAEAPGAKKPGVDGGNGR